MNVNILFDFHDGFKKKETWNVPAKTSLAHLHREVQSMHLGKIVCFRLPMMIANQKGSFKGDLPADRFVDIVRDNPISKFSIDDLLRLGLHYIQAHIYNRGVVESITSFDVGMSADFLDKWGKWYHAIITDIRVSNNVRQFRFHSVGFKNTYDEWSSDIGRISSLGSNIQEIKFSVPGRYPSMQISRFPGQWHTDAERHYNDQFFNDMKVFGSSRVVRVLLNGQEKFTIQTTEETLRLCGKVFIDIFEGDPECIKIPLNVPKMDSYKPIGYYLKTGKVSFPSLNDLVDFIKCADFLGADKILKMVPEHLKHLLAKGVIPNLGSLPYELFIRIIPFNLKKSSYSSMELKLLKKYAAPQKSDHVSLPWELFQIFTREI